MCIPRRHSREFFHLCLRNPYLNFSFYINYIILIIFILYILIIFAILNFFLIHVNFTCVISHLSFYTYDFQIYEIHVNYMNYELRGFQHEIFNFTCTRIIRALIITMLEKL